MRKDFFFQQQETGIKLCFKLFSYQIRVQHFLRQVYLYYIIIMPYNPVVDLYFEIRLFEIQTFDIRKPKKKKNISQ